MSACTWHLLRRLRRYSGVALAFYVCSIAPSLSVNAADDSIAHRYKSHDQSAEYRSHSDYIEVESALVSKAAIVDDFINVAISHQAGTLYVTDRSSPSLLSEVSSIDGFSEIVEEHYPWFSKFFDDINTGRFPDPFAIHKWQSDVSIGLGWPGQAELSISDEVKQTFVDEIHRLTPELEKATGMQVSYMPPEAESIKNKKFGRIRIVPEIDFGQKNVFKKLGVHPKRIGHGPPPPPIEHIEEALFTAVAYTPTSAVQVDGYYVPNSDNSIGLAVCKVYPELEVNLLRSMIRECLVRSLGLPEISEAPNSGLLAEWNAVNANVSKTYRRDGDAALYTVQATLGQSTQQPSYDGQSINSLVRAVNQGFTPRDFWRLRLLYCKEIVPGMGLYNVIRSLTREKQCWAMEENDAD